MTRPPQADRSAVSPQTAAMVLTYQQACTQLRAQLAAYLTALWRSLGQWRNAQVPQFTDQALPMVDGAMQQMQALTAAYLAAVTSGTEVATPVVSVAAVRNGADPVDVYGRPFHLVWRQLGSGANLTDAVQAGVDRVVQLAATDLQLAKTHTSRAALASTNGVVGWQRVLEGPHSCALCVIASTVRYRTEDLMPMHPACDCGVLPLRGEDDPGRTINYPLLVAAHDAVQQQFGSSSSAAREIRGALTSKGKPTLYRDVLITHQHGELGPVIGVRGAGFRGPGDIAA